MDLELKDHIPDCSIEVEMLCTKAYGAQKVIVGYIVICR